jgi:hypothetical protein
METTTNQISQKISTQYAALNSAHHTAALAYSNVFTCPVSPERDRRESAAGLAFNMAAKEVKSFEERHPEVIREGW